MAVIPSKNLGASLTEQLNRAFEREYDVNTDSYRMATSRKDRVLPDYDHNRQQIRSGIESWHARGVEHHLVKQLEERLEKMQALHHEEMRNLVRQVQSMNDLTEARVMHINGFYTWLIETYPETVAQYKALLDLKRLTEGEE